MICTQVRLEAIQVLRALVFTPTQALPPALTLMLKLLRLASQVQLKPEPQTLNPKP